MSLSGSLTFPNSLLSVGEYSFFNKVEVTNIDFSYSKHLTYIGNAAFAKMSLVNQNSIVLPDSLIEIGSFAFDNNEGTYTHDFTLKLPNQLETIGEGAFYRLKLTGTLIIPQTVQQIGAKAFEGSFFDDIINNSSAYT
jgi:hypothetical protein